MMDISSVARSKKSSSYPFETFLYVAQNLDWTSPLPTSAIVDPFRTSRMCPRVFDLCTDSQIFVRHCRLVEVHIFIISTRSESLSIGPGGFPPAVCVSCAGVDMSKRRCNKVSIGGEIWDDIYIQYLFFFETSKLLIYRLLIY